MPTLTNRKIIAGVFVVLSIFVLFMLIYHFRTEVIFVFTGIVISISMAPAVEWLRQHRLSRSLSVIFIYGCLVIVFFAFIFWVIPQMIEQGVALAPRLNVIYDDMISTLQNSPYPFIKQWVSNPRLICDRGWSIKFY